jgi:hypothetical protein
MCFQIFIIDNNFTTGLIKICFVNCFNRSFFLFKIWAFFGGRGSLLRWEKDMIVELSILILLEEVIDRLLQRGLFCFGRRREGPGELIGGIAVLEATLYLMFHGPLVLVGLLPLLESGVVGPDAVVQLLDALFPFSNNRVSPACLHY